MVKNFMKVLMIMTILVSLILGENSFAESASTSFNASITIVPSISISSSNSGLNFGSIIPGSGGSVSISVGGVRTLAGNITSVGIGNFQAAAFAVTGNPNSSYSITIPSGIQLTGSGNPMALSLEIATSSRNISAIGNDSFSIGGTLVIGASQIPGQYNAVIPVTVSY
jgi:hypothetical protein